MQKKGWQSVPFTVAIVIACVIPLVAIFVRDRPSDLGLVAYGALPDAVEPARSTRSPLVHAFSVLRKGFHSRDFWLLFASFFVCGATTNGLVGTHLVPACMDHGIPEVRAALRELQRNFALQPPGAVLDGRDIGTVVCPEADVKIYVTATPEVRARRRHLEMQSRGEPATYEGVLVEIRRRDERDASRDASPMRPAADAFLLDTSNLDIEAAFDTAVGVILRKAGQRGRG